MSGAKAPEIAMNPTVEPISLGHLALAFLPVLIVLVIQIRWALPVRSTAYGIVRMLLQLLLVGYVLVYLFESENAWIASNATAAA